MNTPKKRTTQQNKAYWAWINALADELVEHGIDMKGAIEVPIMATPEMLHENVTKRLIKAAYGKDSTTKLTTKEMSNITEIITKTFSERTDGEVYVPFAEVAIEDYNEYIKNTENINNF